MINPDVPFHLLVLGPFSREQVNCTMTDLRMERNPETDLLIEQAWVERLNLARERGQSLFPGPMCRLRGWEAVEGTLNLSFGLTDYREFVGTNIVNPNIQTRFGEEYLANGTGVCSILVTSDNMLIIQRRSQTVFEHPGLLNFCGGSLNPVPRHGANAADPFAVMTTEFLEEMEIARERIREMVCLGLARDSLTLKPDILLRTNVDLHSEDVLNISGDEHSQLLAIPNHPPGLHQWLSDNWNNIAPSGLASLVAHLACMFAEGMAVSWEDR